MNMSSVGPFTLLASLAIFLFVYTTYAVRWRLVLEQFGAAAGFAGTWQYTFIGGFFNQLLPSGMGGDVFRIWYARNFQMPTGKAIASVLVDRMFGFFAIATIVVVGFPFILAAKPPYVLVLATVLAVSAIASGIVGVLFIDLAQKPILTLILHIRSDAIRRRAQRTVIGLTWMAQSTRKMIAAWPAGFIALSISICNQLLISCVVYLLLSGMGHTIDLKPVVFLFPLVLLLSMLPISFAGWGLRESAMVVAFALVGVPADAALSASILYGLLLLTASLPGAVIWLAMRHRALPA